MRTTASAAPKRATPDSPHRVGSVPLRPVFLRRVEEHHDKEEQHHDGAGVDDDLRHGDKRRVQLDVQPGQCRERHDQEHHAVHRVALPDDEGRGDDGQTGEQVEDDGFSH